jgi:hypothetical protein
VLSRLELASFDLVQARFQLAPLGWRRPAQDHPAVSSREARFTRAAAVCDLS